ncbi:hypothetical protein [Pseudoduganella sp. R-34]|jgi:hypothetical protein|uniref:hypothetical protein n=1 Tax=Pseudoduganella sp. R-34 TaxID=3404062 RepID=UPI003CE7165B
MRSKDQNDWAENEYSAWLQQVGGVHGMPAASDEQVVAVVSDAIREQNPRVKAELWVEGANLCMAMADKTLGAQGLVTTSLALTKH